MGREIDKRQGRVVRGAVLVPGRSGQEDRHAVADAAIEGGSILGAAGERMRQERAREIVISLTGPLRRRIEAEFDATDTTNTPTQNEGHRLLGRALSSVVDTLYDQGQTELAAFRGWEEGGNRHTTLGSMHGDLATEALIDVLGDRNLATELVFDRTAYPVREIPGIFIIEKRWEDAKIADIVMATPAYMESQTPKSS